MKLLKNYFGNTFEIETFKGNFPNRHFLYGESRNLRLACMPLFGNLKEGDIIYLKPINQNKIGIYEEEPEEIIEQTKEIKDEIIKTTEPDVTKLLIDLVKWKGSIHREQFHLTNEVSTHREHF